MKRFNLSIPQEGGVLVWLLNKNVSLNGLVTKIGELFKQY